MLDEASRLRFRVDPLVHDLRQVSVLADRHGLTTYDAAYLELALRRKLGLVTLDRDLADAAASEGVLVQSPGRSGVSQRRRRYNI